MSFDLLWNNASAEQGGSDDNDLTPPPVGDYTATVMDAGVFTAKSGKTFAKVQWQESKGGHTWTDLRKMETPGQFTAAKIMCRSLGIDVSQPMDQATLNSELTSKIGDRFALSITQAKQARADGSLIFNTNVQGPASVAPAPVPVPQTAGVSGDQWGDKPPWA